MNLVSGFLKRACRVSGLIGILRTGGIPATDLDSVKDWATVWEVLAERVSLGILHWG